jgi:hypothetical protein
MTALSDTHSTAEQVQIELLRQAGPVRRAMLARAMTANAIMLSRRAIQLAHPEWSELEVKLFWAEVHYGKELIDKVRAYLKKRERG